MKILDKYIAKNVLAAIGLVTVMLSGLQIFILFVNQLPTLGKANYGLWQAAWFVLLQMPYEVYLFFPMASLLGCLIGLGVLANHSELIVMRAAGMSIGQIAGAVFKASLLVIIFVTVIGETLVPKLSRLASEHKMQALSGHQALYTANGMWVRYQNDFISIRSILPGNVLIEVNRFHFDEAHQLRLAEKIAKIDYTNGQWLAHGVDQTIINDNETQSKHIVEMPWAITLNPGILGVGRREPDELSLVELHQYLSMQKKIKQVTLNYELSFWQRLIQPLTTIVMMLLAIPFIFGPLRSSTMGSKMVAGAVVGFGFHIINRFFGPLSHVLQMPPQIAAIAPTCFFTLLGLYMMRRVK